MTDLLFFIRATWRDGLAAACVFGAVFVFALLGSAFHG